MKNSDIDKNYYPLIEFKKQLKVNAKKTDGYFFQKNIKKENIENSSNYDKICYICFDKPFNIYLKPCRHTGFCITCFKKLLKNSTNCPICK